MTNVCLEKIEKATLNKVKCYIKKMYKDALVQKTAVLAMRDFGICCGFYDNYKKKFNKTENLYEILNFLKEEQINQISKDKKLVKDLNRKIIKDSVDEKLPATDSDGAVMAVSEIDNVAMYFRHSIENCLNGTSYIFQLSHVNQNIWKGVLLAMVFSIPMKKVLRCKKSILKKDYLPSVNAVNNSIWIRINELTTKQDIRLIWKEVEEKQRECIEKYQYLEPGRKYRNRVINELIYDFYNKGVKPQKIAKLMKRSTGRKFTPADISRRIKEHKKYIRAKEAEKLIWFRRM